jgi:hypothetical protein
VTSPLVAEDARKARTHIKFVATVYTVHRALAITTETSLILVRRRHAVVYEGARRCRLSDSVGQTLRQYNSHFSTRQPSGSLHYDTADGRCALVQ